MTTSLPASSPASVVPGRLALFAPDLNGGEGKLGFARQLNDIETPAGTGGILTGKPVPAAFEIEPPNGKKEPGEPSATCLAVVPFVPLPQQLPPVTLEWSPGRSPKKTNGLASEGMPAGAAGAVPVGQLASGAPLASATIAHKEDAPPPPVPSQPTVAGRLPAQFGADRIAGSEAATTEPAEAPPAAGELALAMRLKAQTPGGAVTKAVLEKEPRRVDVEEAPAVQPGREPAFQAAAWTRQEGSQSPVTHGPAEKPGAPPEHLDAAGVRAERPARAAEPLRNLSVQLGQANQEKVELRVTERAGEVRVAVRTADTDLQNGLRQSLPELVHRLEGQGYRTDAWRPSGVADAAAPVGQPHRSSQDFQNQDPQARQGWSQQERGQHNHNHSQRPRWVEELEGNLAGEGTRPTGAFHGYIR